MNCGPVFAYANGVIRIDAQAVRNAGKQSGFLLLLVWRNHHRYRLAHNFFGRIAIKPLCTLVPGRHDTVEADAYDCIITVSTIEASRRDRSSLSRSAASA